MSKYKYQLIQTDVTLSGERSAAYRFLKLCAICSTFLLIVCYTNWPICDSQVGSSTSSLARIEDLQGDQIDSTTEYQFETDADATTGMILPTTPNITLGPNMLDNYFVYTSHCRMPALNPFTKDVLKIYEKTLYETCDASMVLISVNYDDKLGSYKLHMNDPKTKCCYRKIQRFGTGAQADNQYKLLKCTYFRQDFVVPQHVDAVLTECRRLKDKKVLQHDAFGFVQPKKQVNNISVSIETKPSVLLWGIDSMSRMNFERTMPLMHKYLKEENWFELRGYNKMGDNTFPNLMALLTGFNSSRSMSVCKPKSLGGLDACPLLWKDYKKLGYMTAYAEDWGRFSTFNYNKKGFIKPPTDYYPRPLMLAAEKELKKVLVSSIPYCVGHRHYAEYIYDFAIQFTRVYKNQSSFGMFWTNSFSHNNFALPSSMDAKILEYMGTLKKSEVLKKSIVIFFSDHGMRFGPLRSLDSGFLEERMPIMYIWLPQWLKDKYPEYVHNLRINRNRLTSPYDIYATLKHLLALDTPLTDLPRPEGCPSCHSVFHEVAESRDCKDAGIDPHWCTCHTFKRNTKSDNHIKEIAQQLIDATNQYLATNNLTDLCQNLKLSNIESVQRKIGLEVKHYDSYLVRYEAEPEKALFEASTDWDNNTKKISIHVPDISRLDAYASLSKCVEDNIAKKFCICIDQDFIAV